MLVSRTSDCSDYNIDCVELITLILTNNYIILNAMALHLASVSTS